MMTDGKTAALCALACVGGLDMALAFQGSGAASLPAPIETAASSQMPSRLRRGSNPQAVSQHRSLMTTEALQAAASNRSAVHPPVPRVPSTPPVAPVATTDSGGFSSIPIGAPRAGNGKVAQRSSRLNGDQAPNISKPFTPPLMQSDSMGFCWIPVGGRSKNA
jgi:hypothetical protein